jgi:hypothetical protein
MLNIISKDALLNTILLIFMYLIYLDNLLSLGHFLNRIKIADMLSMPY